MAGLAALDVMQRVRRSWEAMATARAQGGAQQQEGREEEDRDEEQEEDDEELGAGYKSKGGDRMGGAGPGRARQQGPRLQSMVREEEGEGGEGAVEGWRDVFEVVARWRQIANPTDATFWKHSLLSPQRVAVRSTTPIHVYNFETVKYYPVHPRAVALTRATLLENEEAFDANYTRFSVPRSSYGSKIEAARDLAELHAAVGQDFSALTLIHSALHPGQRIPGTEFQVKRTNHSYDFYTETVMDADKWSKYDAEMTAAWESLRTAVLDARTQAEDPQLYHHRIQHAILSLAFFWFQVMPLTRGSAMGGMVAILGLSMAADMQTTALIPPNVHVDWEALLSTRLEDFTAQVQPWLYAAVQAPPWHLPLVHQVLSTPRLVLAALTHGSTSESERATSRISHAPHSSAAPASCSAPPIPMPPAFLCPLRLYRIATCAGARPALATWHQMSHYALLPPAASAAPSFIRRPLFSPPASVPSAPIHPPSPLPPPTQAPPFSTPLPRLAPFSAGTIKRKRYVGNEGRRNGGRGCCGGRAVRCATGAGRGKGGGRGGADAGFDEWMRRVADRGGGDVALAPLARRDGGTGEEEDRECDEGLARRDGESAGGLARGDSAGARLGEGDARRHDDRNCGGGDHGGGNDDERGGEGGVGQKEGVEDWMGAESSGLGEFGRADREAGDGGEESWGGEGGGERGEGGEGVRWFEWRECVDVTRAQMESRQLQWNERRRRFEHTCTGSEIDGAATSGGDGGGGGGNGSVFFLAPPLVLLPPTAPQSPQEYIRYLLSRPTLSASPASPPPPSASPRAPALALGSHMVALLCADSAALAIFHQGTLAQHKVITAYTVRAKQGRSQLAQQRGKGAGRMSAGAAIRARETRRLFSEVVQRCVVWEADIRQCELLFFSGDVRAWNEVYACRAPAMPVDRKDERWVKVPFHVARPRLSQVLHVFHRLSHGCYGMEPR
ncbi:unnamed protein product [Closterium sp. NIES-54]